MKKIIKLCACASALVAGCGLLATKPNVNSVDAVEKLTVTNPITNAAGSFEFSAVNMPKKVNAENKEAFFIPAPAVSDDSYAVKINVREGKGGRVYTYDLSTTPAAPFTAVTGGVNFSYYRNTTHYVYFTAEKDGKIFSSAEYEVQVTGIKYSFDINAETSVPTIAGVDDKILLPTLTVLDANGEVVKDGEQNPITVVPYVEKNNVEVEVGTNEDAALKIEDGQYYLYTRELGTYTVRYVATNYTVTPQEVSINVSSAFNSANVVLDVETMSMSSAELGKEVSLPTPVVNDIKHDIEEIAYNYTIKIVNKDGEEVAELENKNKYAFNTKGTYTLEYTITNLYLNNVISETAYVKNVVVSDKTKPEVFLVEDYDPTATNFKEGIEKLNDYVIPSRVGYNGIELPAVYAEDLGTTDINEFTFTRVVVDPSGDEHVVEGDYYEATTYEFGDSSSVKGTYTIEYRVVDANGREGKKTFTVEVLGSEELAYTDNTNLKITLPEINNAMYSDEVKTVKVIAPTDDKDKNLETHYYYYYGAETLFKTAYNASKPADATVAYNFKTLYDAFNAADDGAHKLNELKCENNNLEIKISDYVSGNFTVVAIAINDQGQFAYATEEVLVKNATNDNAAPTVSAVKKDIAATQSFEFASNYVLGDTTEVQLPIVTFTDAVDSSLTISAQYYINDISNGLSGFNNFSFGNSVGGYINLTQAGTYYVVYTAVDDANNSYDYVTSFTVSKKTSYAIDVKYTSSIDVFGSTEINATVYDDDGNKVEAVPVIKFNDGSKVKHEGTEYTFNEAGNYVFTVSATVNGQEVTSGLLTVKVNELEYKWVNEDSIKASVISTNKLGDEVKINLPIYTYGSNEFVADVKVVDPDGDEVALTDIIVDGVRGDVKFTASEEGKYTITFTAGELEKTIYTQVGDNNPPTISIANKNSVPAEISYDNKNITLTLKKNSTIESKTDYNLYKVTLEASTESGKIFSRELEVKLYDINGSGQQVALDWSDAIENGNIKLNNKTSSTSGTTSFKWTISATGDYELTIVAKDAKGCESKAETIEFKVVEKAGSTEKKDNKAGIILIIISIILLAGIVGFFAFAGKSNKGKKVKPVKVEDKKENNDNQ